MTMNMKLESRGSTVCGIGLVALLAGACGDDDGAAASGGATEGASGDTAGTETAGDASATGTSASGSATASGSEGSDGTTATDDGVDEDSGTTSGTTDSATDDGDGSTGGDTNGSTDDGNDDGNDDGTMEICEAPGNVQPCDADTSDPFQAIGLGCAGAADEIIPISNQSFTSMDPQAWQVARQFGSYVDPVTMEPIWGPTEGEQFLIISSGHISTPDANGVITMTNGVHNGGVTNGNPSGQQLPAPMSPLDGSNNGVGGTPFVNCDQINDCSDSLAAQWAAGNSVANDLLWFQFEVEVPGGTHGFEFDFAYFSAEFPEWVNSSYNDIFVVWSTSETYTGNLCFVNDEPCTVRALWPVAFPAGSPELVGTGFEPDGSTGWFSAKASAAPGELLQLTWAVFDMGDTSWDTAVMIDNWRWDCEGCVPSEVNPCGIRPIPT